MTLIELVQQQLTQARYATALRDKLDNPILMFESDSVLGFVICFRDAATLIEDWNIASQRVLREAQFALRRAEAKSWNSYLVLLTGAEASYGESIMLSTIEEDLVGTRKIARAGVTASEQAHAALLPLLPIQNAPRLDAIEMATEMRLRTSELPPELVEAFISNAPETNLIQLLEAKQ